MAKYRYEDLKEIAKKVRFEFAKKGIFVKKGVRKKKRDKEKEKAIYLKAMNRLKKYKPKIIDNKIYLPYFKFFKREEF